VVKVGAVAVAVRVRAVAVRVRALVPEEDLVQALVVDRSLTLPKGRLLKQLLKQLLKLKHRLPNLKPDQLQLLKRRNLPKLNR
tara:strand:+ start:163 stop:411 length:249 start_codon:yes stop_codon:yes gene_type:complete